MLKKHRVRGESSREVLIELVFLKVVFSMNESDFRLTRFMAAAWTFHGNLIPAVEGVVSSQLDHKKIKPHFTCTVGEDNKRTGSLLGLQLMLSFCND